MMNVCQFVPPAVPCSSSWNPHFIEKCEMRRKHADECPRSPHSFHSFDDDMCCRACTISLMKSFDLHPPDPKIESTHQSCITTHLYNSIDSRQIGRNLAGIRRRRKDGAQRFSHWFIRYYWSIARSTWWINNKYPLNRCVFLCATPLTVDLGRCRTFLQIRRVPMTTFHRHSRALVSPPKIDQTVSCALIFRLCHKRRYTPSRHPFIAANVSSTNSEYDGRTHSYFIHAQCRPVLPYSNAPQK